MRFIHLFIPFIFLFSVGVNAELSTQQKREMKTTIENMRAVLPRRIDAMTTLVGTKMVGSTWVLETRINTGGRILADTGKSYMRNYIKQQYCRPPYEYLDAGLIIENRYYDENGKYLFTASASKSICGR